MTPEPTIHTPRYLSPKNTAYRYGTSKSTIYLHIKLGHFRAIKFGGRTLIDVSNADTFFDALPQLSLKPPKRSRVGRSNP
jgi:hypothetical protein